MPYKASLTKRHHIKKHTYRQSNYSDYNNALKNRGRIDVWILDDVLDGSVAKFRLSTSVLNSRYNYAASA